MPDYKLKRKRIIFVRKLIHELWQEQKGCVSLGILTSAFALICGGLFELIIRSFIISEITKLIIIAFAVVLIVFFLSLFIIENGKAIRQKWLEFKGKSDV